MALSLGQFHGLQSLPLLWDGSVESGMSQQREAPRQNPGRVPGSEPRPWTLESEVRSLYPPSEVRLNAFRPKEKRAAFGKTARFDYLSASSLTKEKETRLCNPSDRPRGYASFNGYPVALRLKHRANALPLAAETKRLAGTGAREAARLRWPVPLSWHEKQKEVGPQRGTPNLLYLELVGSAQFRDRKEQRPGRHWGGTACLTSVSVSGASGLPPVPWTDTT
jgi:hypothetical protein